MTRAKTQAITNFFINSSLVERLSETAKGMSFLARQAHLNKDFKQLNILAEGLINFSSRTENLGRYYSALSLSRYGQGDSSTACEIFSELADSKITELKAAATLALGRTQLHFKQYDEACRTLRDSSQIAASNNICAPFIYVQSQIVLSVLCAEMGAESESRSILRGVESMVNTLGISYPAILGEFWNNLACSYMELDCLDKASYYSKKAVSMKVAVNYPEWFETKQAIDQKLYEHNLKKLVSLRNYDKARISGKVSDIHSRQTQRAIPINLEFFGFSHEVLKFLVDDSQESEIRLTVMINTLFSLSVREETGIKLCAYFSPDDENSYFQCNIPWMNVHDLLVVLDNIERHEAAHPLKEFGVNADHDPEPEASVETTLEWVKSLING